MKTIFADAFYWIALINPKDEWHHKVMAIARSLDNTKIVTTEEILSELLTFYANAGTRQRQRAIALVKNIIDDPNIFVVEQSHKSFLADEFVRKSRR